MRQRVRWMVSMMVAVGLTMVVSASAMASTPDQVVQERTEAVATVLAQPESEERTERLAATIDESIDFEFLASLALRGHWEERTDEERQEFMTLLRRLLQANYEERLGGYELDEDYEIHYEESREREDRAFVPAVIDGKERRESVVYRLYRDDGQWVIYDVVVDDISLEETYRDGYVPIIEDHGWGELIERMERRVDALEEG